MERNVSQIVIIALIVLFLVFITAIGVSASYRTQVMPVYRVAGGDPLQGPAAIQVYGCGSCHTIPNVPGADGKVGPSLAGLALRTYIAGRLPNSPENLILWIQHPQSVDPGVDMPEMGVTEPAARDIAAYLYTLR